MPGSVTPSTASRNGGAPWATSAATRSSRSASGSSAAWATHALGGLGAGLGEQSGAGDLADGHLEVEGEIDDVLEHLGVVLVLGDEDLADSAAAGEQQLADGLATLDLVAAEAPCAPAGATGHGPDRARAVAARSAAPSPRPPATAGPCDARGRWRRRPIGLANGGLGVLRPLGLDRLLGRRRRAASARPASPAPAALAPLSSRGAHRALTTATAKQAMPSARPMAPRPSARLPFTVTGAPTAALSRSCIASGGARASALAHDGAVDVARLPARGAHPAGDLGEQTDAVGARPTRGSVSGKCSPMSPRPAAPSSASAQAWATTSASLWPTRPGSPSNTTPPSTSTRSGRR